MQQGTVTRSQSGAERSGLTSDTQSEKSASTASGKNPPKEFRVAALVKRNAGANVNRQKAAEASGSNDPPAVTTEDRTLEGPSHSGGIQTTLGVDQVREIVRVEATPICLRVVSQTLGEELPATQVAMREDITTAITDLWSQLPDMIDAQIKDSEVAWTRQKKEEFQKLEQEHASSKSRLLAKIDTLEGEVNKLSAEVTELRTTKATQQPFPLGNTVERSSPRSKKESTKSKKKKAETSDEDDSSSGSDRNHSDSSDSDSSSSSRSPRRGSRRKKTFAERNPRNRRFRKVLSYRKYRLEKRSPKQSGNIRKRVASWTKRMSTSVAKFSGKDPISVLKFLATFKTAADNNGISEGGACLVLRNFLEGRALVAFDASLHIDAVTTDSSGIKTWQDAVHWLLSTYAKDIYIQQAVQEIRALRQRENETEYDYGHRVLTTFSRMPGVYKQEDQIMTFVDGLPEIISAGVIRDRNTNPECYETLQTVLELADSHGVAERARKPPRPSTKMPPPRPGRRVLPVESQPISIASSSTHPSSSSYGAQDGEGVLVVDEDYAGSFSFPQTPTSYSYASSEDTRTYTPEMMPQESEDVESYQTAAEVLPVVSNHNPRLEPYAQPNRPGWIDRNKRPQVLQRRPVYRPVTSEPAHHSCFLCASVTHYIMDCPMVSDSMRNEARRNIAEASPQQRKFLPKWTFALAGVPSPTQVQAPTTPQNQQAEAEVRNRTETSPAQEKRQGA